MNDLVGQTLLGRYHVENFIGRGGMAEVYKVWDAERATHLAMKLLHEDLALDRVFLRRFQREANTLARLQHPNIVRFYELERADRLAFILLDYIDGDTLKHIIFDANGPLPPARILEIMRPVTSALVYAHNRGLIHCDVKPANIMVHRNGTVLVTDFGIARTADAATVTMVGVGTPAYMAPEQVRGHEPTPQTDVYALGIILYEMVTGGERPFTGERAQVTGTTAEKVRWEQINVSPLSPREYLPDLNLHIEEVLMKALEKSASQRYRTVAGMLTAVEKAFGATASEVSTLIDSPSPLPVDVSDKVVSESHSESEGAVAGINPVWFAIGGIGLALLLLAAFVFGGRFEAQPSQETAQEVVVVTATSAPSTLQTSSVPTESSVRESTPQESTPIPTLDELSLAQQGIANNSEWIPHIEEFGGIRMALVPSGCFRMGSVTGNADETPVHEQCFDSPFWIDYYEVTNRQFAEFLNARGNQSEFGEEWYDMYDEDALLSLQGGVWQVSIGYANSPVVEVTWFGANAYCDFRGGRLPTEAEWEYAARGPDGLNYPWGNEFVATNAVYLDNSGRLRADVGTRPAGASWVGAEDMAGNVWEWTSSIYLDYPVTETQVAFNASTPVVLRGGAWDRPAGELRASYRSTGYPTGSVDSFGLRCVRDN